MPLKPIHHTFAPHVTAGYALRSKMLLLSPWRWRRVDAHIALSAGLLARYGGSVKLFASGREALLSVLQAMGIRSGDEIIVQGYTCVVVPNAITAAGGVPVYADIDPESLNLNADTVRAVLTEKTRAVICQHTFGIPSDVRALKALCAERRIMLIEDCAHVLPDARGPKDMARTGDAVIASFGRDKAISGISGGAVIAWNEALTSALERQPMMAEMPRLLIARLLLYPLLYVIARPLYGVFVGKALLWFARKARLLPPILHDEEKEGAMNATLHTLAYPFAKLALREIRELERINDHRRMLTSFYKEEAEKRGWAYPKNISSDMPLQKFPLFVENAWRVRSRLKRKNIHLDDGWAGCVICPAHSNEEKSRYVRGSDPSAEQAAQSILSLPTHPTMTLKQAKTLVRLLEPMLERSA